jgi:hypothetical protein
MNKRNNNTSQADSDAQIPKRRSRTKPIKSVHKELPQDEDTQEKSVEPIDEVPATKGAPQGAIRGSH